MNQEGPAFFMGLLFGVIAGAGTAIPLVEGSWRTETVHRGVAEYNSTTGAWQWKEPYGLRPVPGQEIGQAQPEEHAGK